MTILPKTIRPTGREEREAYELATDRDNNTCQRCLRDCGMGVTSRDHRKGRGVGGLTTVANLQVLGGTGTTGCHGWATTHPKEALEDGWAVPSWADPLVWPARRWVRNQYGVTNLCWVLYTNDGRVILITDEEAARRMNGMVA